MASPFTMGSGGQNWPSEGSHLQAQHGGGDFGPQVRPMGLKVHYTFDQESQVRCLARWPHILQVQAIPLDDRTCIGVVDLRLCLQAIAHCSPEIVAQQEIDYTVYATDYSEPDTPLVGQGILSWGLDGPLASEDPDSQKVVTGRVTKNLLAIFGNGIKETLEVKLKLTSVPRMQRAEPTPPDSTSMSMGMDMEMQQATGAPTPMDNREWNSFIQSNPNLGRSANVAPVPASSPSFGHAHPATNPPGLARETSNDSNLAPPSQKPTPSPIQTQLVPPPAEEPVTAPTSTDTTGSKKAARPSRPSSRAGRATGRPRGRPRKKPQGGQGNEGHTSAAEEVTDADDNPKKKRVKTTKADWSDKAPLGATPDSLRVAASTSGSLRTMRPVGAVGEAGSASHLQEVPRAPTPVPGLKANGQIRKMMAAKSRRQSLAIFESSAEPQPFYNDNTMQAGQSQDARSPTESIAPSPVEQYTPEESPVDLRSSPPVPRSGAYLQSTPPPSSPVLPPMPRQQPDSGFMSGGVDDMFDEEELSPELPRTVKPRPTTIKPRPTKSNSRRGSRAAAPTSELEFQEVNPGPVHLLPVTSIYKPPPHVLLAQSRAAVPNNPPVPQLKRSNTEPNPSRPALEQPGTEQASQDIQLVDSVFQMTEDSRPNGESRGLSLPQDVPILERDSLALAMLLSAPSHTDQGHGLTLPADPGSASEPAMPPVSDQLPSAALTNSGSAPSRARQSNSAVGVVLPLPQCTMDNPCPPSDCPASDTERDPRSNKNLAKKQSIKEKLEQAVDNGELPPYCNNCGAIETPTWRKMWTQDHYGVPEYCEYSEKPGHVTAIDIIERDPQGKPTMYRLVKKTLGPKEDKSFWNMMLLCNPCGIWLSKFKCHRPRERWEKDASRLGQPRKKRDPNSKSRRTQNKSDAQMNPTSEAYFFTTDPMGPLEDEGTPTKLETTERDTRSMSQTQPPSREPSQLPNSFTSHHAPAFGGSPNRRGPGSTHSRGSGTAESPIAVDDDMGNIRRLLFPSPRKDGVPKVLGEVAVNVVQAVPEFRPAGKEAMMVAMADKENVAVAHRAPVTPEMGGGHDEMEDLFGTPPPRLSTPPPNSRSMETAIGGQFKTPTRPTPSHRPITRSISKSIRSAKPIPLSPSQALLCVPNTPSKTPRSLSGGLFSSVKRTPRGQLLQAHFAVDDEHVRVTQPPVALFESPFTASLNQLLSEANDFTTGSPSHGLAEFDLSGLPMSNNDHHQDNSTSAHDSIDFSTFLSTDMIMPSSPPLLGHRKRGGHHQHHNTGRDHHDTGAGLGLGLSSGKSAPDQHDPRGQNGPSAADGIDDIVMW